MDHRRPHSNQYEVVSKLEVFYKLIYAFQKSWRFISGNERSMGLGNLLRVILSQRRHLQQQPRRPADVRLQSRVRRKTVRERNYELRRTSVRHVWVWRRMRPIGGRTTTCVFVGHSTARLSMRMRRWVPRTQLRQMRYRISEIVFQMRPRATGWRGLILL